MSKEEFVKDYPGLFDPEVYLKLYYGETIDKTMFYLAEEMYKAVCKGDLKGDRLLDIGTGPCIYSVISAAPRFKEIYLSDFTPANRTFLRKWLDGTANHSFQTFYEFFLNLEGSTCHWTEREKELRSKVKDILPCDVLRDSILETDVGQFDVITSSLCLEAAATDLACYEEICKKIYSMLKPGGHLVLTGVLKQTYYVVGEHKFYTFYNRREDLFKAWESAGFRIISFEEQKMREGDNSNYDTGSAFVLFAKK